MKTDKVVIIYCFAICFFLLLAGVLSAKNTQELLNSFIYLPLVFYFGLKLLFYKHKVTLVKRVVPLNKNNHTISVNKPTPAEATVINPEPVKVADNDKRLFLKLIGSAGVSLLFMAMFTKKAQASFFGSAPVGPSTVGLKDSLGNKIDPAEKKPTDGYEISNIDDAGNPQYYGFIKKTGAWYIMQKNSGSFLYAKGNDSYTTNWAARGALTYDYYNTVFG